jgi:hypothetical protein
MLIEITLAPVDGSEQSKAVREFLRLVAEECGDPATRPLIKFGSQETQAFWNLLSRGGKIRWSVGEESQP